MNGRHIIVSHCFSCSKSSKRCLTIYILFILIICGNIELNPGFTPGLEPKNDSIFSNYIKSKGMKILHMNARSLSSKIDEIRLLIEELKPDLFCVCESWLNCDISDIEVELSDYHLLRKDRSDGRIGGGIAFYIRKNRNFEYERINNETSFEFITLKLKFKNKKAFYVSSVYRPPDSSISTNNWNEFLDLLSCPAGSEHIILGDINVDLLKSDSKEWINSAKISGYNQLIDSPTRVTDSLLIIFMSLQWIIFQVLVI